MRVYLDTIVLVSAFTARCLCADLFRMLLAEHEIATGEVNLVELRRVLRERFRATEGQMEVVEAQLRDQIVIPRPQATTDIVLRDTDDGWVLASAVAGAAGLLVTGDQDLLEVADRAPLPIVSPRAAWELLRRPA